MSHSSIHVIKVVQVILVIKVMPLQNADNSSHGKIRNIGHAIRTGHVGQAWHMIHVNRGIPGSNPYHIGHASHGSNSSHASL